MKSQRRYHILFALTMFACMGTGIDAGVFFAFSTFVMRALMRIPPIQGLSAMQSINLCVHSPLFALAIFGTAAASLALMIWAFVDRSIPGRAYLLLGGFLYLAVAMGVTFGINVPQNDIVSMLNAERAQDIRSWTEIAPNWTAWNHVRTVGALAAAIFYTLAIFKTGERKEF